jgi:hypothetical protein
MPGTRSPGDHAGVPQNDVSKAAPRHPLPPALSGRFSGRGLTSTKPLERRQCSSAWQRSTDESVPGRPEQQRLTVDRRQTSGRHVITHQVGQR